MLIRVPEDFGKVKSLGIGTFPLPKFQKYFDKW